MKHELAAIAFAILCLTAVLDTKGTEPTDLTSGLTAIAGILAAAACTWQILEGLV